MRILFTGGGTGGHIFPILAAIRELKRVAEEERILDIQLFYMGPDDLGTRAFTLEEVVRIPVLSGKWRTGGTEDAGHNILDLLRLGTGIVQACWNMFLVMPDVVFSKGGYGALPSVIAATLFRIPIMIHESDAVPGKVNMFSARFATRIGIAFASAARFFPPAKTALVGIPIRRAVLGGLVDDARESFSILSQLPVIGIMGGSQGAEHLNETILSALKELTERYEVVHQVGERNVANVEAEANVILESGQKQRYRCRGFMDEAGMRDFYAIANLIVSRAGATSIFEIAGHGLPSLLIPLPHAAQDHQRENAYAYAESGAAVVIEEANLAPHVLIAEIGKIMGDASVRKSMADAAEKFYRPDSAEIIAREILKLGVH